MTSIQAVIFDLDGVVRHFEPYDPIEADLGLPPGSLMTAAVASDQRVGATTGHVTFEEWIVAMGDELAREHGEHARAAAAAFGSVPARVDHAVVELATTLRAAGCTTAILTNGTTRVEMECDALGIPAHFDHLFNSARIGVAKPDRRVFEHVVTALGIAPRACVFVDDSEMKLAGAAEIGMHVHHYNGVEPLRRWLRDDLALPC